MGPILVFNVSCSCTLVVYFCHKIRYVRIVVFASLTDDFFQVTAMQFLASQANGVKSAKLPDALMKALKTLNGCIGNNKFLLGVSQVVNLLGDSPHLSKSSVRPLPVFGRRFLGNYKPLNKI